MQSAQITILYETHNNRGPFKPRSFFRDGKKLSNDEDPRSILSKSRSSVYDAYFRACFMPWHEAQLKSFLKFFPQRRPWNFWPAILNRNFNNGEELLEGASSPSTGLRAVREIQRKSTLKLEIVHETERKLNEERYRTKNKTSKSRENDL